MDEIKKDKDLIIAKMHHRTTVLTAVIGAIVTLLGVAVPVIIANKNAANDAQVTNQTTPTVSGTVIPTTTSTSTPEPTKTPEPTVTQEAKKGKGK
jgi:hypothetical protein